MVLPTLHCQRNWIITCFHPAVHVSKINFPHFRLFTNLISHHKPHLLFLSLANSVLQPQAPDQFFICPMSMHSSVPFLQLFSVSTEKSSLLYHLLNVFFLLSYLFKLSFPISSTITNHYLLWVPSA